MDRREALRFLALGTFAAGFSISACDFETRQKFDNAYAPADLADWENKFFTDHEMETVRQLTNLIIPADGRSGNAEEAGVPQFIDFMMVDKPENQTPVRGGLSWLDDKCREMFDNNFIDCSEEDKRSMLDSIAYPDVAEPGMQPGVAFFNRMRDFTATGFWTSKMGIEDINYIGNIATSWDGCSSKALEHLGVSYDGG